MSDDFWKGSGELVKRAREARERKNEGARKGMVLALRNTLNASNEHVPHEEGDLERDGGISLDDAKLRGAVSYGRSAQTKDYAVIQHEDMTLHHDAGRNAKFLENAFNTTRQANAEILAKAIGKEMGTA